MHFQEAIRSHKQGFQYQTSHVGDAIRQGDRVQATVCMLEGRKSLSSASAKSLLEYMQTGRYDVPAAAGLLPLIRFSNACKFENFEIPGSHQISSCSIKKRSPYPHVHIIAQVA